MAGLYYWFPKMTGRMLSEGLGKVSFWLMVIGFNAHLPATVLGRHVGHAAPDRSSTSASGSLHGYNVVSTIGSFILAAGVLVTVVQRGLEPAQGRGGGARPVARQHARVVHDLAAAGAQLRRDPDRPQPRADEGHPPRRAEREARLGAATSTEPPSEREAEPIA